MTGPERGSRESERQRRLAALLDAAVPESTRDDLPEPGAEQDSRTDERLRDEVPPHHG